MAPTEIPERLHRAFSAHLRDSSSTWQVHERAGTIEFAWFHPQTGEFMMSAEYEIKSGELVGYSYFPDVAPGTE